MNSDASGLQSCNGGFLDGIRDGILDAFLTITGGSNYGYSDCLGECVQYWNGWTDELITALLAAENASLGGVMGKGKDVFPTPRKAKRFGGSKKKNTTNWQNAWKVLPPKFRTAKILKLMKLSGRVNVAITLLEGAKAAAIEAHCAGHCGGIESGTRYNPGNDKEWF